MGMTRIFSDDGEQIPVTVLRLEKVQVVAQKTQEKDGYSALKLGSGSIKAKKL
jgi:large subunit ribosomal protein L3